jgi:hypothetical protein
MCSNEWKKEKLLGKIFNRKALYRLKMGHYEEMGEHIYVYTGEFYLDI